MLDENVIAKHADLTNTNLNPIEIRHLFEIVTDENIRDSDEAYLASQFKLVFVSTFEQLLSYCINCANPSIAFIGVLNS